MKFIQFVNSMASACELDVDDVEKMDIQSEDVDKRVSVLINVMQPKMSRLDSIEIPFIENTFVDERIIKSKLGKCSKIDDAIINRLTFGLFNKSYDKLTGEQSNIIKVLTAYIVLQSTEI